MMKVANWSKYQSYKDRRPPWIRFHRTMLDNYEFQMMSADARALLPMLWLLACEDEDPSSGNIPLEVEAISFRLRIDKSTLVKCLDELESAGFIDCDQSVTKPLRNRNETVPTETETETETEKPLARASKQKYSIEFGLFWDTYPSHRRGNKKKAFEHWKKIPDDLYDEITNHVAARKSQDAKWLESNGKYIPHAERFLSGERWEEGWMQESKFSDVTQKNLSNWANIGDLND